MRLSHLLNSAVLDADDRVVGRVHDVRLLQDGPPMGPFGAAFRVAGMLVGPWSLGARLGFERRDVKGPWPLKVAFERLHARALGPRWSDLRSIEQGIVRLRASARDVQDEDQLARGAAGRVVDAGLEILDRQIVDVHGAVAGKVDDLELSLGDGGPPVVTAILTGPGALCERLGGRLGRVLAAVDERLSNPGAEGPGRISFATVASIETDVQLSTPGEDLPGATAETWVRTTIIEKIPGA